MAEIENLSELSVFVSFTEGKVKYGILITRVPSVVTLCRQRPSLSILPLPSSLPLQFPLCVQERRRRVVVRRSAAGNGQIHKNESCCFLPPLRSFFSSMAAEEDDFPAVTASDRRRHNFLCCKQPSPPLFRESLVRSYFPPRRE